MGYELHITRADDWSGSAASPIGESEWVRMASTDDRMRRVGESEFYTWRDENGPSLYWFDGQVNVKGVRSEAEIGELATFAMALDARLQGDDGESYDSSGRPHD